MPKLEASCTEEGSFNFPVYLQIYVGKLEDDPYGGASERNSERLHHPATYIAYGPHLL